jgi:hypothetical protein
LVNPNKIGLVIGALLGGWHLIWSLVVLIGWAQPIIDFILGAYDQAGLLHQALQCAGCSYPDRDDCRDRIHLWFSRRDHLE